MQAGARGATVDVRVCEEADGTYSSTEFTLATNVPELYTQPCQSLWPLRRHAKIVVSKVCRYADAVVVHGMSYIPYDDLVTVLSSTLAKEILHLPLEEINCIRHSFGEEVERYVMRFGEFLDMPNWSAYGTSCGWNELYAIGVMHFPEFYRQSKALFDAPGVWYTSRSVKAFEPAVVDFGDRRLAYECDVRNPCRKASLLAKKKRRRRCTGWRSGTVCKASSAKRRDSEYPEHTLH